MAAKNPERVASGRKGGQAKARGQQAAKKKRKAVAKPTGAPKGGRLTAAQQGLRDTLIVTRIAQGWTWAEAAEEAGITEAAAKRAAKKRREAQPLQLNLDPARIIEQIFEGYQLSVGDLERIATEAANRNNLNVAVGAKKGANEAREKMLALLQATGRLPQELSALRHLIDLRAIAVKMLDTVDRFVVAAKAIPMEDEARALLDAEVGRVRTTFHELIGLEEDDPPQIAA